MSHDTLKRSRSEMDSASKKVHHVSWSLLSSESPHSYFFPSLPFIPLPSPPLPFPSLPFIPLPSPPLPSPPSGSS